MDENQPEKASHSLTLLTPPPVTDRRRGTHVEGELVRVRLVAYAALGEGKVMVPIAGVERHATHDTKTLASPPQTPTPDSTMPPRTKGRIVSPIKPS